MRLSSLLTRERSGLPAFYLKDEGLRNAYRLYFLPSNLPKIHMPLGELAAHPSGILTKERLRVLDIGSGPGTALLGLLTFFPGLGPAAKRPVLECTAADPVEENLREAEHLFRHYQEECGVPASLRTIRSDATDLAGHLRGRFDLMVLSNVLNELFAADQDRTGRRVEFLTGLTEKHLAGDGSLIIIEPALRETSRDLLMVRDELVGRGFRVYSPCLRQGGCPALENPKDWRHEEVPWEPPELVKEIDRRIGLRKDALKFSYIVIRKDSLSLADVFGEDAFRVVSEPLVSKGKREFYICGRKGRRLVTLLDKDRTTANEAFGGMERGTIVSFDGLLEEERRFKVGKETAVRVLRRSFRLG
jgi:SAM-dependent methyltransferase